MVPDAAAESDTQRAGAAVVSRVGTVRAVPVPTGHSAAASDSIQQSRAVDHPDEAQLDDTQSDDTQSDDTRSDDTEPDDTEPDVAEFDDPQLDDPQLDDT
ncbi:MAG TPA: hypothetical protein VFI00_11830 [Kribbella sp.]|nr:hypothetical protein [Kribbella sp.]